MYKHYVLYNFDRANFTVNTVNMKQLYITKNLFSN